MLINKESFKKLYCAKLQALHGESIDETSTYDQYVALGSLLRDYISPNWIKTNRQYRFRGEKQLYYFSIEFLLGKQLEMNLINMGLREVCEKGLAELGIDLNTLLDEEPEAGLGNGGLGRLAACFLDSMAALGFPGHGCGIRYTYGLFEQKIVENYQVELPDNWLKDGYIWEYRKPDKSVEVKFGGQVVGREDADGRIHFVQENVEVVLAVPYDVPMVGYHVNTVNTLRLWSAELAQSDVNLTSCNREDYIKALEYKNSVERISKYLYPDDTFVEGRLLRLKQEYFFVSAGLQSIIRRFKRTYWSFHSFPEKIGVHINDTHPALAVPELMRILIDVEGLGWDEAWRITTRTISYTNHTVMPEALETWPVDLFKSLLPRIYMIIEEINKRFCQELWDRYPGQWGYIGDMAIISYGLVHMARLAVVGSYSVNGVAKLHTQILQKYIMHKFYEYDPRKFNNKTNGITHRRWLLKANATLAELINKSIGENWISNPSELLLLRRFDHDVAFKEQLADIKRRNKEKLAQIIQEKYNITVNTQSIFDVQIKRIHAYKRQILNVLHIMHLYNQLKENPNLDIMPRTFIFAGKAAPGYYIAKQTIKLINSLGAIINNDKTIQDKLKVVFMENYGVSIGEIVFPAADVSEQISTASKEASGTGNMKFMMNGAVTIGTLDGANIEIEEAVGPENIIIFGLTAEQALAYYAHGGYNAWDIYNQDGRVKKVMEQLVNGFLHGEKEEFRPLYDYLLRNNDEFFVLKDFSAYAEAQRLLDAKYRNQEQWRSMCLHNVAHSGIFSSDRTIQEYSYKIWNLKKSHIRG
ncbi:glycogen/starch/alpha-glucan phosphorylase [Pelosinus sp. IPA-1]|uniref:glycogen/starch/alpha-glucan phosphorylase n=1 Tax=Pelosinus sp. IPA-1 TaxID=3029569 RepID=UPI00243619CF|nr:glycogen/starch/alpha-glucan phosphorylase [Pelosinus sp. IPA-1]GMB01461.1 alpha-1,4 glucan phosphorylase [Pelosinus sp. IPA-1]